MLEAVGMTMWHADNLHAALSPLADRHARGLRLDPTNFPLLSSGKFTVEIQTEWDKFPMGLAVVLRRSSRPREYRSA
ncbi:hypothetical protein E2I00_011538, partial [Balaenoptera physalus]